MPTSLKLLCYNALSILVLLAVWWSLTHAGKPGASVSPHAVWARLSDVATNGYMGASIGESAGISAVRVVTGWLLSGLIGVVLGLIIGLNPYGRAIVDPWLNYGRCVPPLGYLSLVVLWFGVGSASKLVLLLLSGVPLVAVGTAAAVAAVRRERIEGACSMGFGPLGRLRFIILPSALPGILVSLRIAFGAVFAALVGAEMVASSSGIAWMTITAVNRGDMALVIGCILIMGIFALFVDACLQRLTRVLVPWAGRA